MELRPLYEQKGRPVRVAGFLSGTGSNIEKLIEHELGLPKGGKHSHSPPFHVALLFSNSFESGIQDLRWKFRLPAFVYDLDYFCGRTGRSKGNLGARREFDRYIARIISPYDLDIIACGGYANFITEALFSHYLCINVHPADLTIMADHGRPKYRGLHAVRDAILAGEKELRSTTHIIASDTGCVKKDVDCGQILMLSEPVEIILPNYFDPSDKNMLDEAAALNQNSLKQEGDWKIFPKTIELIAAGRYAFDGQRNLYFDGKPAPNGIKIEEARN